MEITFSIKDVIKYEVFFDNLIVKNEHFNKHYALVKNLSYNMQYLEFLSISLKESIHATIRMEFYKTFVITGVSVIESILYYLLRSKNLHRTQNYKVLTKFTSNEREIDGIQTKIESTVLQKISTAIEEEMTLDSMLKKVESKHLLGTDHEIYKELNHLRKLRNKIHLYYIEAHLDTDWNNFSEREFNMIKKVLRTVLHSNIFLLEQEKKEILFSFLK